MFRNTISAILVTLLLACGFVCNASLLELQMAYASPYVNIDVTAAYNMITNGSYPDITVLDVRTKGEYDGGHIYRAVWIPVTELETRIGELAGHKDHEIIVYCKSGGRSVTSSGILDSHEFTKVYNMLGGITAWQGAGYPVWIATVHNLNTTFNYDTIQAALDAPQTLDGHTIFADAGEYYEHVIIDKPNLTLIGENRDTTIIDGNESGIGVYIYADNIKVMGFTIQNAISGILSRSHNRCIIQGNIITSNSYAGVNIDSSNESTICDNLIVSNHDGVGVFGGNNNTIHDNNFTENEIGLMVDYSQDNTIYHNNFIGNVQQADVYMQIRYNSWDDGYPSSGNYWSDYAGADEYSGPNQDQPGSDGIGDTPYVIEANNTDHYPLMNPWTPPPIIQMRPELVASRKYCENFTIKMDISDACNVEDFEFEIRYYATLLDYADITWDAWGTGSIDSSTDGVLIGSTSGTPISGTATLITITLHAAYYHVWKDCPGWTNDLSGTIYFQWANLSYPDSPDLRYEKGGLNQIAVNQVDYTFMPIQGDINNDGSVSILDISLVAWYYEQDYAAYDLNCDGIIDIFDLVIIAANLWYEYDC